MTKKVMTMPEMPLFEGAVRQDFLAAAKQSSSFLNDRQYPPEDQMMRDMLKADLIATGKFAIGNTIGGRAIAARIRDEASRFWPEREIETWF